MAKWREMLALHCCAQVALCFLGRHLPPGTMPCLCRNRAHPEDDRLIAFPCSPHKTNAAFCKRVHTSYLGSQAWCRAPPNARWSSSFPQPLFHQISPFCVPAFAQFLPHLHCLLPKPSPCSAPTFPLTAVPLGSPFPP